MRYQNVHQNKDFLICFSIYSEVLNNHVYTIEVHRFPRFLRISCVASNLCKKICTFDISFDVMLIFYKLFVWCITKLSSKQKQYIVRVTIYEVT